MTLISNQKQLRYFLNSDWSEVLTQNQFLTCCWSIDFSQLVLLRPPNSQFLDLSMVVGQLVSEIQIMKDLVVLEIT